MNDIYNEVRNIFKKPRCKKSISYQKPFFKFSASSKVEDVISFDIKELSNQTQEVAQASTLAKILDDYQYLLCTEMENNLDDPVYVKRLRGFRMLMCSSITVVRTLLEQLKAGVNITQLKPEFIKINSKMRNLIRKMEESLFRGLSDD